MRNFILLLGEHRVSYVLVTILSALIFGGEAVIHPLLLVGIFDAVTLAENFTAFIYLGLGYLALGLSVNILSYFLALWRLRIDNRVVADVSEKLLSAYYAKSYGDILSEGSGYYVARIRSDVKDGLRPMLEMVRDMFTSIVSFVLLIVVLVYISWKAFAILVIIIPIATLISILVSKKIRYLTEIERDTEAAVLDTLTKSVSSFKIVRAFFLRRKSVEAFRAKMDHALDSVYRKFKVIRLLHGASDLTMNISDVCSIFVGGFLVFRKQMTIGSFIGFMNAFWRAATTLMSIFNDWAELHGLSATVDRLADFMKKNPTPTIITRTGTSVVARDISYAYGKNDVLSDFSMLVNPGERALIIGDNGSGKTTLANVLAGDLAPTRGELTLPYSVSPITLPLNFPPLSVKELPIDTTLLRRFALDTSEIREAWPEHLSAGQQQKVALCLALSHEADLYVLDEPLANLDTASKDLAMQEILDRTKGKMLIMILHDAESYKPKFDQILELSLNVAEVDAQMSLVKK